MENVNFNYCGKNLMEKKIRAQENIAKYLAEQKLAESERENQEAINEREALMANSKFTNSSAYVRSRDRARRLQESLTYRDRSTKNAMTEYIMNIVEDALLLDKDEYAAINPNYKEENRELIREFLDNADINQNIKNRQTLTIMEHISKSLPQVATGVLLTESEVTGLVTAAENNKVDAAIASLADNIQSKVAEIVSAEQENKEKIQNDLDEIVEITDEIVEITESALFEAKKLAAGEAPKMKKKDHKEAVEEEEVPEEEIEEELDEEDIPEGEVEVVEEEPDEEEVPEEDTAVETEIPPDSSARKETSIEIGKDGKLKIRITNEGNAFVEEVPKNGILETLAVNEGVKMIEEGKEYNGDLALAKAINYLTILETFDAMGLFSVGKENFDSIIRAGGGVPNYRYQSPEYLRK